MLEPWPVTEAVSPSELGQHLDKLVKKVRRGQARLLIEENGAPLAAVVSVADLEELKRLDRQRAELFEVIDRMRDAFADVPEDELEAEVDKAIAEVRAENAAEAERARARK